MDAWRIPGVASYAFCLFFSKLIAYTFLYWLPYYIKSTAIEGRLLSAKEAGDLSVLFDVGGVAGGERQQGKHAIIGNMKVIEWCLRVQGARSLELQQSSL